MQLLDLPEELLASIPQFLRNIEDFNNARSSCRMLRRIFEDTSPNTILHLAARSSPTFFHPEPHFLILCAARRLSNWALGNEECTAELRKRLQGGVHSLFRLCLEKSGVTLDEIRRLHLLRFTAINPLIDQVDKMAGKQWCGTPDFWDGGVSEAATLYTESDRVTYQILIYGELFSSSMDAFLVPKKQRTGQKLSHFDLYVRMDYIKYCIPDWTYNGGFPGTKGIPMDKYDTADEDRHCWQGPTPEDLESAGHILKCSRWKRLWAPLLQSIGPDFTVDWKQELWRNATMHTIGLNTLDTLFQFPRSQEGRGDGISLEYREALVQTWEKINALEEQDKPGLREMGDDKYLNDASEAPDFPTDTRICERFIILDRRTIFRKKHPTSTSYPDYGP